MARLGDSWDVVGPVKQSLWLRRIDNGTFGIANAIVIEDGVLSGQMDSIMAAQFWGRAVLDMRPGDCPIKVALAAWREWE